MNAKRTLVFLTALASSLAVAGSLVASSHTDAPLITLDDTANTTDVYAFRSSSGGVEYLTTAVAVFPFEEPANGPNIYRFDDSVLYEIHVALDTRDRDGGDDDSSSSDDDSTSDNDSKGASFGGDSSSDSSSDGGGGCGFEFIDGVLVITSDQAILIVTVTNADGLVAECAVDLCARCPDPGAGDDDDDDANANFWDFGGAGGKNNK